MLHWRPLEYVTSAYNPKCPHTLPRGLLTSKSLPRDVDAIWLQLRILRCRSDIRIFLPDNGFVDDFQKLKNVMMSNRIALITGPTSGIGYVTAIELAKKGFDLILVARNETKLRELQKVIGAGVKTDFIVCDLSSISAVKSAVECIKSRYSKIDVLINNAGLLIQHKQFSVDGIELTFATNHLGPFILTTGLIELLKAAGHARIVHVSSAAHFFGFFDIDKLVNPPSYNDLAVYGRSKLANILFSNELSDRLVPFGITSNAVHPGTVASNFARVGDGVSAFFFKLFRPFFKTVEQGAATSIYLASSPDVEGVSGNYFVDCKPGRTSSASKNRKLGKQLWKLSEDLVAKYEDDHI